MVALAIYNPTHLTTEPAPDAYSRRILGEDNPYYIFFDLDRAYQTVMNGDYRPNTRRAYELDLAVFMEYLTSRKALPTPYVLQAYKAHLGHPHYRRNRNGEWVFEEKPRTNSTKNRMLVPARLFCRALADQQHDYTAVRQLAQQVFSPEAAADIITSLWQLKDSIRRAAEISPFKQKTDAHTSAMMQYGTRLELNIARALVRSIDVRTLHDHRDKTILILMLNTALRLDEVLRLTQNDIHPAGQTHTITLERKGGKIATTPIPTPIYQILLAYIAAHNAHVADPSDPRYIHPHTPIFRRFARHNPHTSGDVLTDKGLRHIIQTRAKAFDPTIKLNPHDLRRTAAYISVLSGMPYHKIQQLLGHNDISTTQRYIGKLQEWESACLDTYGALIS